ncbi:UPF0182 family membrane protein [Nocardioides donggukensis]|uniref:UPF0182 protein IE331_11305 n=1 Tax=Nocardioides donggukensis TaxID=2774019 RepID=A0A927Q056_9ACTN|nr:UPF0182 family protein [Nocardioides donggukensis]MBD8870210.1 UPF0182 family protein [Nocardioides donggukensis]
MSGMFEDETPDAKATAPPPEPPRSRALVITIAVLVGLFLAFTGFASFWTERLWFSSVGYQKVFTTLLTTRVGLFLVFGLLMAAAVAVNMAVAYRFRPIFRPASPEQVSLDRYRVAVNPVRLWLLAGISLLIGTFAGATASGKWREYLLWRNSEPFGSSDPYFERDLGFYLFDLPWLHYLVDYVMAVAVLSLIAAAVVHYLFGGIRLQSAQDRFSGPAAAQLSVLVGIFVLGKAADYYLDRFDLLNEGGALITGVTFTDENAVLPAKNILMFIALICALLFLANIVRRTWLLPTVGLGLLVLSSILLGLVWPAAVQQFQVDPTEADKEAPYIARNIEATRAAYDIEDAEIDAYAAQSDLPPEQLADVAINSPGIRLVDPQVVQQTFEQRQQVRGYYSVPPVLDVDNYTINGEERDVVLATRELNQDGISSGSQNWANLHTVYTHGYGVIAAFGNQRPANNETVLTGQEPAWAETDIPPKGELTDLTPDGYEGRIYFGENSPSYSIVGKSSEDATDVELDLPSGDEGAGSDTTTTYDGADGVEVGSFFKKALYAWKFGEPNIVLSGRVNENSKILYDRDPALRVEKVAPWLTVDSDPFPAVVDGRVVWLLDGYTTTDQYPLSERGSFQDMTTDALDTGNEFRTLPTDEINYMRNAVKATVDAYDGTVTLYEWDEEDPMLKAWMGAFPGTVEPKSEIPDGILDHMRYPEDMFKVQRFQLAAYHVTDAGDFYEANDRWQVPTDPNNTSSLQPPYRLSVETPDDSDTFSLTSVYTPANRENLAAFVSVDADAAKDGYGTLRVKRLSSSSQIPGPGQIANQIQSDQAVTQALLPYNRETNTRVVNGNLLTLPVGDGLLYVQPLYSLRTSGDGNFPVLRFVAVSFGDDVGVGRTLGEAIYDVLGLSGTPSDTDNGDGTPPDEGNGGGGGGNGGGGGDNGATGTVEERVRGLLNRADAKFAEADEELQNGNSVGWAQAMEEARDLVARAIRVANTADEEPAPDEEPAADGE